MSDYIPIAKPYLDEQELQNVTEAVKSGWISSKGKFILEFEERFAKFCGVNYGVATSNGTTALHLALAVLGIGPGDEVIIPTLTFVATANAVKYVGATPVFVDSTASYWCIDPERIEQAVTEKTKAIIPVHLYGHPCDLELIMAVAKKHDLYVIEDAAEAHGAEYKGKRVGGFGLINCFSFYGNKIITTGEGGMCLTDNKKLTDKMRIFRDHGMNPRRKYWHDQIGYNYRMTNLQAAIGVAQLDKLEWFISQKREIAQWYSEGLMQLANKKLIKLHPVMSWAKCVYWLYSILLEDQAGVNRDKLINLLRTKKIDSRPFFNPIHKMPPYKTKLKFPCAEKLSRSGINLPSSVNLRKEDIAHICKMIGRLVGRAR